MAILEEYILINMEADSDDEEDEVIEHIPPRPRLRVTHAKAFCMTNYHFKKSYRLTKPLVLALIEELKPFIITPNRASDLTAEMKVSRFLLLLPSMLRAYTRHVWEIIKTQMFHRLRFQLH
ncbi:hypothetical protein ACJJTC_008758 [Scirpophaga incertulas]